MKKRLLVLNVEVSGMNKYLFSQLRKRGWDLTIIDVPFPKLFWWWGLVSTFRPNIAQWKKRLGEKIEKLYKTAWAFMQRTKYCQKKIKKLEGKFDLILQISGMFAPFYYNSEHNNRHIYTVMLSYTMALSNGYPAWEAASTEKDQWLKLETGLYQNAQAIFTTNENARQSLIKDYGIKEERTLKVGYGLTLEEIPHFPKVYDGKTILFMGMDFERKGGFVLLKAFKQLKAQIPDAKLIIVGPNKDIYKINEPGVEMLGCVRNRKIVQDLYQQASIFVLPSLCEPFGLVLLEAMAYQLPCIGTTVDAMTEIIADGQTGFLVAPKDAPALAEKLSALLTNPELLTKMGEAAHKRVQEIFSWDSVGENLDAQLTALLL